MTNNHSSFVDQYLSDRRDIPKPEILLRVYEKLTRTEYALAATISKLPMRKKSIEQYPRNKKRNVDKLDRVNKSISVYKTAIERLHAVIERLEETKTAQHAK